MLVCMQVSTLSRRIGRPAIAGRQRFVLQLPDELADQVRAVAEAERRSINAQMQVLIERGLEAPRPAVAA